MIAPKCSADTVEAAAPLATVIVNTYTPTPGVASRPITVISSRFAAVSVTAPEAATAVPDELVCLICKFTDTPDVPTVKAAQPCNLIPETTAMSLKLGMVRVAIVVSDDPDGEAATVCVDTNRADRSLKMMFSLSGCGMARI